MTTFGSLSTRSQVRHMRAAAMTALADYDVEVVGIRLVNHGFNTTFRVDGRDSGGLVRRFALRVNVNSPRTVANVIAETAWVSALAAESDVHVPIPQPTHRGQLWTTVWCPALGRDLPVVLYSWLSGSTLGEGAGVGRIRQVGRAMAMLHQHARTWPLPAAARLPTVGNVLMGQPNRLTPEHPHLRSFASADVHVITTAMTHTSNEIATLMDSSPCHVIHADIHGWNLMWGDGRLAVFDFDDCGVSAAAHDLAITSYYLRDDMRLHDALCEGYASVATLPTFTASQFEALVAARNLAIANDLINTTNAAHRQLIGGYLTTTVTRLRAYLDSGVYRHHVDAT